MLTFTDRAQEAVLDYSDQDAGERPALRITFHDGSPLAPRYDLTLVSPADRENGEVEMDAGDFLVFVQSANTTQLEGATVDFVERDTESGFEIRDMTTPGGFGGSQGPLADRVRDLLDQQVNPGIAAHGGFISLVGVKKNDVYIEMSGGCQGCALSRMTLRQGVEKMLREAIPEMGELHDVTDHATGENPYFESTGSNL